MSAELNTNTTSPIEGELAVNKDPNQVTVASLIIPVSTTVMAKDNVDTIDVPLTPVSKLKNRLKIEFAKDFDLDKIVYDPKQGVLLGIEK